MEGSKLSEIPGFRKLVTMNNAAGVIKWFSWVIGKLNFMHTKDPSTLNLRVQLQISAM